MRLKKILLFLTFSLPSRYRTYKIIFIQLLQLKFLIEESFVYFSDSVALHEFKTLSNGLEIETPE